MKKIITLSLIMFIFLVNNFAQDTLKVLQYNLLYYGLYDKDCNASNNNVGDKTNYLKTIITYIKPDIFAVNEINASTSPTNYHDFLLGNVFIYNGFPNYARGTVHGSYFTQQIFYNKNKLTLVSENSISAYPRDVLVYNFYYNSPDIANGDTVFITYLLTHLKAGNTDDDVSKRNTTANSIMNYLDYQNTSPNYILSGDFNLYTSDEGAYQRFTNYSNSSLNFTDPAPAGAWHGNSAFTQYHTQSTFINRIGNCSSGGGLDDRFDFILFSNAIKNNSNKIQYINNSLKTIGQDGQHLDTNVAANGNSSAPSYIIDALANNSDHLPVYSEFLINQTPAKLTLTNNQNIDYIRIIKATKNTIQISIQNDNFLTEKLELNIYDIQGRNIYSTKINTYKNTTDYFIQTPNLLNGIYIALFKNNTTTSKTIKFIIY